MHKKLSCTRGRGGKLLLLLTLLMAMFCLTGCMENQVDIETVVKVDAKGAGTRCMTLSLDENKLTGGFAFSTDELTAMLKDACPKSLKWSKQSDSGDYSYLFTLNFSSIEDYRKKVAALTGKTIQITYQSAYGTFSSGIRYKENFTSADLFGWLSKALEEKGYIESGTNLFYEGAVQVKKGDDTYTSSGNTADIDMIRDAWAEGMDVFTTYRQNGRCDRKLMIWFDNTTYAESEEIIKKRMQARCPDNAEMSWDSQDGKRCCIITVSNIGSKKLNSFMKSILKDSESMVHADGSRWDTVLSKTTDWNETLDVLALTEGGNAKLSLGYYVAWDKNVSLAVREKNEKADIELAKSSRYPDFYTVYEGNTYNCSFTTTFAVTFAVSDINVEDRFKKGNHLARTITMTFKKTPSEEELSSICEKLKERDKDQAEISSEDGKLVIYANTSVKGQNKIFENLFGTEGQTSHEVSQKLLELRHKGTFSETLDFTGFLENDPEKTTLNYVVRFGSAEKVDADSCVTDVKSSDVTMETGRHKVKVETTGAFLSLSLETRTLNTSGFTLLGILLALVLILVAVRLLAVHARKFWAHVKSGSSEFRHAFDGRDEEEQEMLEQRYEDEVKKKPAFGLQGRRKRSTDNAPQDDPKTSAGTASGPETDYFDMDDALYYGESYRTEQTAGETPEGRTETAGTWDPSKLVESVTESEVHTEDENRQ